MMSNIAVRPPRCTGIGAPGVAGGTAQGAGHVEQAGQGGLARRVIGTGCLQREQAAAALLDASQKFAWVDSAVPKVNFFVAAPGAPEPASQSVATRLSRLLPRAFDGAELHHESWHAPQQLAQLTQALREGGGIIDNKIVRDGLWLPFEAQG